MNIFKDKGIRITLTDDQSFLKVKETLTRIGIASKKDKTLFQSCHILHKQGQYAILHFKELFQLDNKVSDFTEEDEGRRNTIVNLLEQWGLVKITADDVEYSQEPLVPMSKIKILSHSEKPQWTLQTKYTIGKK